jgi:NADH-quinone oxidoreductase subunit C
MTEAHGGEDNTAAAAEEDVAAPAEPSEWLGWPLTDSHGQAVVHCTRQGYLELMTGLRAEGFDMCVDLCGVDYLNHASRDLPARIPAERFEVVVNLLSLGQRRRVRVRVQVPEGEPALPTLFDLWPGTEAMEREAFDMFGVRFEGHPDLTRILMPEDWEGHPLRKDYGVGRIPVQFKAAGPRMREETS